MSRFPYSSGLRLSVPPAQALKPEPPTTKPLSLEDSSPEFLFKQKRSSYNSLDPCRHLIRRKLVPARLRDRRHYYAEKGCTLILREPQMHLSILLSAGLIERKPRLATIQRIEIAMPWEIS